MSGINRPFESSTATLAKPTDDFYNKIGTLPT